VSSAVDDRRLQTFFQTLQTALEETREGILVTDQAGNLLHVNRRFVSMWGLPASAAELKRTDEVLAYMMDQLKTPETLRRTMIELDVQPDTDSYDMLERKDGRIIERSSRPTREVDLPRGRVWIFRDVTGAGVPADAMMACSVPILERAAGSWGRSAG
jgi:PAS domain S-box-containing protein